jgi:hypothetical protein
MDVRKYSNERSFLDFLFNALFWFIAITIIAILFINPIKPTENSLKRNAEYIVSIKWQDGSDHDVDLWALDESENARRIVGFMNKQSKYLHLERDDLGIDAAASEELKNLNEEHMVLRGLPETGGRFVYSAHFYKKNSDTRLPVVEWKLYKVNPTFTILKSGKIDLNSVNEEKPFLAFDLDKDKKLTYIDHEGRNFVLNRYN